MLKKIFIGVIGFCLLAAAGLFVWVRSSLGSDAVKNALAQQIAAAIGQPVTIGGVNAGLYPRVTVALQDVAIGGQSEIAIESLDVGTSLGALLSRRIEHATLALEGARLRFPLPALTLGSVNAGETPAAGGAPSTPPVQIVSIDSVVLKDVAIVSGGRTLTGNIDVVPQGQGLSITHIDLTAEDTSFTATGTITDLAGPAGDIALKAGALNVDRLIAFFNDFSSGLPLAAPASGTPAPPKAPGASAPMNLTVSIDAERATLGGLTIEAMSGTARATDTLVSVDPLSFRLFHGKYDGGLSATLGTAQPTFHWKANISGIDVAAATAYAGSPNTVTGTLNAAVDIKGTGADAATAIRTAAGQVRFEVLDGIVRNLGMIRAVTAATALNAEGIQAPRASAANADEPFTRIGATVRIASGTATTENLQFDAADLALQAAGTARLDGSALDFRGRVQLSDALSGQMNQTVVRLTQEQGRITLPATITGTLRAPSVRVDAGDAAKRALRNTVKDAAPTLIDRGIRGLMRK